MNLVDEISYIDDGAKTASGNIQYFNDIIDYTYENAIQCSLNWGYHTIIYSYIDSLNFNRSSFSKIYKHIYERVKFGNTGDKHIHLLSWLNCTYGVLMSLKSDKFISCKEDIALLIRSYLNNIYDKFKENFIDNIIAIDCDTIYLKNNNNLIEILEDTKLFEVSIRHLDKLYFKGKKKYQILDSNNKIIKSIGIKI